MVHVTEQTIGSGQQLAHRVLEGFLAQAAPGQGGSFLSSLPLIALMLAIFYFFLWRPQAKQQKEHRAMLASLKKGDTVVFSGGLLGRIHSVGEKSMVIDAGRDLRLRVLTTAVTGKAPEGLLEEPEKLEAKSDTKEK